MTSDQQVSTVPNFPYPLGLAKGNGKAQAPRQDAQEPHPHNQARRKGATIYQYSNY